MKQDIFQIEIKIKDYLKNPFMRDLFSFNLKEAVSLKDIANHTEEILKVHSKF